MPSITCTNCNYSFEVDNHCFNSKDMVFNCDNCGTEISKNLTKQLWEGKSKEFIPKLVEAEKSVKYQIGIFSKIKLIQNIIRFSGCVYAFLISISFYETGETILFILLSITSYRMISL